MNCLKCNKQVPAGQRYCAGKKHACEGVERIPFLTYMNTVGMFWPRSIDAEKRRKEANRKQLPFKVRLGELGNRWAIIEPNEATS